MTEKPQFSDERLQDLLCCALEGGSNYWYWIKSFNYPDNETKYSLGIEFAHLQLPFKGGSLTIGDRFDQLPDKTLDRAAIDRGLQVMLEKYPKHYADFLHEDEDADTGDVFLQCALYGEVIFG